MKVNAYSPHEFEKVTDTDNYLCTLGTRKVAV
jgi:hypothetical protein